MIGRYVGGSSGRCLLSGAANLLVSRSLSLLSVSQSVKKASNGRLSRRVLFDMRDS